MNKMRISHLLLLPVLFCLLGSHAMSKAQFRRATCEVQPLWVGKEVRSSNFGLMGTFETNNDVIRSFPLKDTRLIATVAVAFDSDDSTHKPKPYQIRLAITVSEKEETKIFESVQSSEAKTRYTKKWSLAVTKNVDFDDLVYMFTLRCWDSEGFGQKRPF